MESKKAELYLNRVYKGSIDVKAYNRKMVGKAVEIAEQEMREKAADSFCKTICGGKDSDCESCTLIKTFKSGLI